MAKEQVSSILRTLRILECFMDMDTEWTLKEHQYLNQDSVRKSYRVGPRLLQLASAIMGQSDLRRTARPELERLSEVARETINLSMLLEHEIFY